jgi:hypothetical protein
VVVVAALFTGCIGGDDDGDDAEGGPDATLSPPETLAPIPVEATIAAASLAGEDSGSLDEVLADDTVTADELAASYERYIECLASGGGAGRYAFDIELRTGLVVDWAVDDSGGGTVDRDVLGASCSRRYLGDLTHRFESANPAPDDLSERQRASIAACIETVSPEAAANLPQEISVGTGGDASSLSELQLDPSALDPEVLGSSPDDIAAISDCIAAVGTEWRPFG